MPTESTWWLWGRTAGRGFRILALGSVAERVLRIATCPVQVVKSGAIAQDKVEQAIEALSAAFGSELAGDRGSTEHQICEAIRQRLDVTSGVATDLFERLKETEWAIWTEIQATVKANGNFLRALSFWTTFANPIRTTVNLRQLKWCGAPGSYGRPISMWTRHRLAEAACDFASTGSWRSIRRLEHSVAEHLINQWKLMAGLDSADPFRPKEGRVEFPASADQAEARITTAPVAGGEAAALRLFTRSDVHIPLPVLGLSESALGAVESMIRQSEGLVLVSGPTGSGKTTTVYSMLESLGSSNRMIVSVEDPVEFAVKFVRQMEVSVRHGITMTDGLKTVLRMDPDVIFLGEIRDAAAAEITMRAAGSGRYVFSTLHTRDVAGVFTALRDFGLTDRSIAANVSGVVNQRLMRRLCIRCRREVNTTDRLRSSAKLTACQLLITTSNTEDAPVVEVLAISGVWAFTKLPRYCRRFGRQWRINAQKPKSGPCCVIREWSAWKRMR